MRRVLSLWQPWATLCVEPDRMTEDDSPAKMWETRSFKPRFALPIEVAIHATKRESELPTDVAFVETLSRLGYWHGRPRHNPGRMKNLPFGAIIGVASISYIESTTTMLDTWTEMSRASLDARQRKIIQNEIAFGNYSRGRFAWRLSYARALPCPIPFSGRQDVLYVLDDAVDLEIERQLT